MSRLLHTLLTFTWGLWFGGLVMLFVAVSSLFRTFDQAHEIAGAAASGVFHSFNHLRLILAGVALLLTFVWWVMKPSPGKMAVFIFFAVAAFAAVYITAVLTPQIEDMRQRGQTVGPLFRRMHGMSMGVYLAETIAVLIAGALLPGLAKGSMQNGFETGRTI